jgi:anion-transporting  ArsA/GET3 family ATPase
MTVVSERSMLSRRLLVITGKGGTGKTTVSAAIALEAAARGKRVALFEMGRDRHLPPILVPEREHAPENGSELTPGITYFHIEPFDTLAEYLHLKVGIRRLVDMSVKNQAFRQLLIGAPGWRELVTLGKIGYEEQMREDGGRHRFDHLIVDAPASGHGLTLLDIPRVTRSVVRAGPLRRSALAIEELIQDPERCLLLPVTLAEELPAHETAELVTRLREEVKIPMDRVIVNAVADAPFPASMRELPERLAQLPDDLLPPDCPTPQVLAACGASRRARYELNRSFLSTIADSTALPVATLPLQKRGIRGPEDLVPLGRRLLDDIAHDAEASA